MGINDINFVPLVSYEMFLPAHSLYHIRLRPRLTVEFVVVEVIFNMKEVERSGAQTVDTIEYGEVIIPNC